MSNTTSSQSLKKSWLIWLLVSSFSLLQFFIQVSGNLIILQLVHSFNISYYAAGSLIGVFFWLYLLVQVPAGALLDNYGTRKVLILAASTLLLGSLIFVTTSNFYIAIVGRALMGLGAGFAFISMIYSIYEWFPPQMYGLVIGLGELVGMIGTTIGQLFAPHLILAFNWQSLLWVVVIAALLIICGMFLALHDKTKHKSKPLKSIFKVMWRSFRTIVKIPGVWLAGIFCLGTFAILPVFVDSWATLFFEKVDHLNYLQAARLIAFLLIGIAVGGPALGWVIDRTRKLKGIMLTAAILACSAVICLIMLNNLSTITIAMLMFVIGFFSSIYLFAFLVVRKVVPHEAVGVASAFCNMLCLLGTFTQPIVGYLLMGTHTTAYYQHVYLILPAIIILGIIAGFLLKIPQDS